MNEQFLKATQIEVLLLLLQSLSLVEELLLLIHLCKQPNFLSLSSPISNPHSINFGQFLLAEAPCETERCGLIHFQTQQKPSIAEMQSDASFSLRSRALAPPACLGRCTIYSVSRGQQKCEVQARPQVTKVPSNGFRDDSSYHRAVKIESGGAFRAEEAVHTQSDSRNP